MIEQKNLQTFSPCMIEQKTCNPSTHVWLKKKHQKPKNNNLQPFNPKEDDNIFAIIVIVQFNNKF